MDDLGYSQVKPGTFMDPLLLRAYAKREWALAASFGYRSLAGKTYVAPHYFITDLASIPWLAEPFFDSTEHREAGVIHDWIYCSQALPRDEADDLFEEMLKVLGATPTRASAARLGLRIGSAPRYSACKGGLKVEDLAFELMSAEEASIWKLHLNIITKEEKLNR